MPKVYVLVDSFLGDLTLDIVACATKGAARIVKSMHRSTEYHDEPDLYGGAHVLDEAGVRKYLADMSFGSSTIPCYTTVIRAEIGHEDCVCALQQNGICLC
jgi:hypothetical protein